MNKQAKVYIAGHTGMVGSEIVDKFRVEGYENLVLKTHSELDLLDQSTVKKFFEAEKPEVVILSAARVGGIAANIKYQGEFLYENLQIQNNVIWQAHLSGVKKFLFLASSCVYPRECQQPMKEEYLLGGKVEPTNEGYAIAKIAGIKLCEKIYKQFNEKFISCMPTNIYGGNDHFDIETSHVIPALIRRMHEAKEQSAKEVVIWGTGNSRREFLYSADLADAIFWIVENYDESDFLNIGTGEDISIREVAVLIKEMVGYQGELVFDSTKPDGMPKKLLDVSRIRALGYKHKESLESGLKKTYESFLKRF